MFYFCSFYIFILWLLLQSLDAWHSGQPSELLYFMGTVPCVTSTRVAVL